MDVSPEGQTMELGLEEYKIELTRALLQELVMTFRGQEKLHGRAHAEEFITTYISSLVSTLVYELLSRYTDSVDPDAGRHALVDLTHLKRFLEVSVASGLKAGVQSVALDPAPEYIVSIKRRRD